MSITRKRQFIYNEIKELTEQISKLSITIALSNQTPITKENAERLINQSKRENPEIFDARISEFIRGYRENGSPIIFGKTEDFFVYDPNEINPLHLTILFILARGKIVDSEFFCCYSDFCDAAEKFGYTNISKFFKTEILADCTPIHNILRIFS